MNMKRYLPIIAGMIINLAIGALHILGSINPYIASYYRIIQNQKVTPSLTGLIQTCGTFVFNIGVTSGPYIYSKMNINNFILIFGFLQAFSLFFNSFVPYFFLFAGFWLLTIMLGGSVQSIPLYICSSLYPEKKGAVTGLILGCYAAGSAITTQIALFQVNPKNEKPIWSEQDNETYFCNIIAERFPNAQRIVSVYYFTLLCIAYFLLHASREIIIKLKHEGKILERPEIPNEKWENLEKIKINKIEKFNIFEKEDEIKKSNEPEITSLKDVLKTCKLYLLISQVFVGFWVIPFYNSQQKVYGFVKDHSDEFLSLIASLTFVINGFSRLIFGKLSDSISQRKLFIILISISFALSLVMRFLSHMGFVYGTWMILQGICTGGIYVLLPLTTISLFGPKIGTSAYGIVLMGSSSAAICSFLAVNFVKPQIGWDNLFFLFCGGLFYALIGFILFPFKDKEKNQIKEKSIFKQ